MKTKLFDMVDTDYIFTAITADRAVEYTGKEVYVADSIKGLETVIKDGATRTLEGINSNLCELRFNVHNDDCTTNAYALCVPADKVIKREKQLRPFKSVKEFVETTGLDIGQCVVIRQTKGVHANLWTIKCLITAIADYVDDTPSITFGDDCWSVEELAANYEYSKDNGETWLPFGVAE